MKSPAEILKEEQQALLARFLAGLEPNFPARNAEILGEYFRQSFAKSQVGPRLRLARNPFALIALGGYGRKEQCLRSDVDLLLLFDGRVPAEAKALVQEILYPLWDLGLEVGYAVRSLRECLAIAARDFEVLTSLTDARFLCGLPAVCFALMEHVYAKILRRCAGRFVTWHVDRSRTRHRRYGDSSFLLEPDLKEGLGGLRDYHALLWILRARRGVRSLEDLKDLGILSPDEFQGLSEALAFLWSVRNRLHHLAGRKCDRLHFQYQVNISESMGFFRRMGQRGVERFLAVLHGHLEFIKHLHLAFLDRETPSPRWPPLRLRTRTRGLVASRRGLDFEHPELIASAPSLLLKIFVQSGRLGLPLSLEARRIVRGSLGLVDDALRRSPGTSAALRRIVSDASDVTSVLGEMFHKGLLGALLPEIRGIVHRIQYDEYHHYPIHTHLVQTLQNIKDLEGHGLPLWDSLGSSILADLSDPEPLYWAALLHDAGKQGSGRNHAERGARIARKILRRVGLPEDRAELAVFLVREHLLLVHTATQRDLNDEKVVVQCAQQVRTIEALRTLYLLTIADCKATGPRAWTEWTSVLLRELFYKVLHVLERGDLVNTAAVETVEKKRLAFLASQADLSREEKSALFEQMSIRYVLQTPSEDILRHVDLYRKLSDRPFVLDYRIGPAGDLRTLVLCARDRAGLFSKTAGVLTLNGFDILSARIHTWRNGIALDLLHLKAPPAPLFEHERLARVESDLQAALEGALCLDEELSRKRKQEGPTRTGPLPLAADRIVLDNSRSDFFTVIEVTTRDEPGLLYRLTDALYRAGLDIRAARIATKVDQGLDVFYVRELEGGKVEEESRIQEIRAALASAIGASEGSSEEVCDSTYQ